MRILFDGYWWQRGPAANRAVQRELILAWARAHPDDDLVVALPVGADAAGLPPGAEVARSRVWPHAASNHWELPVLARRSRVDVTVCHNYAPASGDALVFVHDVMFEEHPEWFSRAERLYFQPMLPWATRAAAVATSSRTEAERMLRHAPALASPVVTGLGVRPALDGPRERPAAVPEHGEFAVTVGRLNVRKNLETVMLAAARSERITPRTPLYVVGTAAHSGVVSSIPARARPLLEDGRIVMLGAVPDAQLAWLYANASLTVSLSLDEGFGMPSVEAAHFSSPLLVSDIPVFRETVGDCATFVEPLDERAAARALDATWGARPARSPSTDRYSWDAAARALAAAVR
ncbi:glycosyltransferase family 1 protein [Agrococcus citreus]|uniref:Glycosyltransferase family 1 protein n=1 Tax=Agrococcus citreus TaxID=84643 RepID=A0ABN1YLK2_9MICO